MHHSGASGFPLNTQHMVKEKTNEPLRAYTRALHKQRLLRMLEEHPEQIRLGTFKIERMLVLFGHMLREFANEFDGHEQTHAINNRPTLRELGDEYHALGLELWEKKPKNIRSEKQTIDSLIKKVAQLERRLS